MHAAPIRHGYEAAWLRLQLNEAEAFEAKALASASWFQQSKLRLRFGFITAGSSHQTWVRSCFGLGFSSTKLKLLRLKLWLQLHGFNSQSFGFVWLHDRGLHTHVWLPYSSPQDWFDFRTVNSGHKIHEETEEICWLKTFLTWGSICPDVWKVFTALSKASDTRKFILGHLFLRWQSS